MRAYTHPETDKPTVYLLYERESFAKIQELSVNKQGAVDYLKTHHAQLENLIDPENEACDFLYAEGFRGDLYIFYSDCVRIQNVEFMARRRAQLVSKSYYQ